MLDHNLLIGLNAFNSCVRVKSKGRLTFGSQWLNPHLRTQGESRVMRPFLLPISRATVAILSLNRLMQRKDRAIRITA